MLRRLLMLSALAVFGFAAAIGASLDSSSTASAAPAAPPFGETGIVVRVLAGDTLDVRLRRGLRERVRVLGIDAPDPGREECHAAQATAATRRLTLGKLVRLSGDRSQAARDRGRRLVAYVRLPDGGDLGRSLVAAGAATVTLVNGRRFGRIGPYRSTEAGARSERLGLWRCADAAPTASAAPARPAPPDSSTGTTTAGTLTGEADGDTSTTATSTMPVPACHTSYPDMCEPPIAP